MSTRTARRRGSFPAAGRTSPTTSCTSTRSSPPASEGTLLAYRSDVWHRGTDFARPDAARAVLVAGFRPAAAEWFSYDAFGRLGNSRVFAEFVRGQVARRPRAVRHPATGPPVLERRDRRRDGGPIPRPRRDALARRRVVVALAVSVNSLHMRPELGRICKQLTDPADLAVDAQRPGAARAPGRCRVPNQGSRVSSRRRGRSRRGRSARGRRAWRRRGRSACGSRCAGRTGRHRPGCS